MTKHTLSATLTGDPEAVQTAFNGIVLAIGARYTIRPGTFRVEIDPERTGTATWTWETVAVEAETTP